MDFSRTFQDPELCRALLIKLEKTLEKYGKPLRFMEVCGTHTVAIFQSGLRSLLPKSIIHLSGPGCPVCVTHDSEVLLFLELAQKKDTIIAIFGDLMRVPAPDGRTLKHAQAQGAQVQIVYSPLDAVKLAKENPQKEVVFLGVGFETTAPAIAVAVILAKREGVKNFSVLSCHKLVPPALDALLASEDTNIDAFLLPGHVALVLGLEPFQFLAEKYNKPAVVAGFDAADILYSLICMMEQLTEAKPAVTNTYTRAVSNEGNPAAQAILNQVFVVDDTNWRGLGLIPQSGLAVRKELADFDAFAKFGLVLPETKPLPGCQCGLVLSGRITPDQCPLFGKVCTPQNPTGPCMVSTEGSCAAWYNYQGIILD